MKTKIILAVSLLLSVLCLAACSEKPKEKQIPLFTGMTFKEDARLVTELEIDMVETDPEDTAGTSDSEKEPASGDETEPESPEGKGEGKSAFIEVLINNRDKYEIDSLVLNGKKYDRPDFTDGSSAELVIVRITLPSTPGSVEYYLGGIKYIDGEALLDVDMSGGNRTLTVNVK